LRYLFVVGCSRTGTTALGDILNHDERILLGIERFKKVGKEISPAHFQRDRFFAINESDTDVFERVKDTERFMQRWDSGTLEYVGDKNPAFFRVLPRLAEQFAGVKIVFMFRDLLPVASSFNVKAYNPKSRWPREGDYRRAVLQWHESMRCLKEFEDSAGHVPVFPVEYEKFYSGCADSFQALYDYLELPMSQEAETAFRSACAKWHKRSTKPLELTEEMIDFLNDQRDQELETWMRSRLPQY
jgi:hypothetical protein